MQIIRELSAKLVVLQLFSLFFFEEAFVKFSLFRNADLYECVLRNDADTIRHCGELYMERGVTIGQLMSEPIHFMLYGLCFGLILTISIIVLRKKSLWNTALVILVCLLLFFMGVFKFRFVNLLVNSFTRFFASKLDVAGLIGLSMAFLVGVLLVWLSVMNFTRQKAR